MFDIRKNGLEEIEEVRFEDAESVTEEYATVVAKSQDSDGADCIGIRTEDADTVVFITNRSAENLIKALQYALDKDWGLGDGEYRFLGLVESSNDID